MPNLGWVDGGSVWRYDRTTGTAALVPVDEGTHLRLSAGTGVNSVVVQHGLDEVFSMSVRSWSSLAEPLVHVVADGREATVTGDLSAFDGHPRLFVGYLRNDAIGAPGHFLAEVGRSDIRVRRLDWFDHGKYDHDYQSVISALELPSGHFLFAVRRSSDLVLCDPTDPSEHNHLEAPR